MKLFVLVGSLIVLISCNQFLNKNSTKKIKDSSGSSASFDPYDLVPDSIDLCIKYRDCSIKSHNLPKHGMRGETIEIDINFQFSNTCGNRARVVEEYKNDTIILSVLGKYVGCRCGTLMKDSSIPYSFTPSKRGIHVVKFINNKSEEISEIEIK